MSLYQHPKGSGNFYQFFRQSRREANICDTDWPDLTGEASNSSARARARKILTCISREIDLFLLLYKGYEQLQNLRRNSGATCFIM